MKKKSLIFPIALLALMLGSCSSSKKAEEQPAQPAAEQPAAQAPASEESQPAATATPAVTGLIPPTNPDRRRQEVAQGRSNPFDFMPVPAKVTVEPKEPEATPQPQPPAPTQPQSQSQPSAPPTASSPGSQPATPQAVNPQTPPVAPPTASVPPAPPQPTLARQVAVTGLIEVGGVTQIIVKAPNEPFSRYVQAGQYIADGQVLVKRIDSFDSPTPVVVLEEVGQEVYKEVGETVEASASDAQASQATTALVSFY